MAMLDVVNSVMRFCVGKGDRSLVRGQWRRVSKIWASGAADSRLLSIDQKRNWWIR
jgi:hypothetical protein